MISKKLAAVVASIILSAPPALSAETVELTSGEVLIGRVVALDDSSLTLQVGFPKVEIRTIQRSEVVPSSLYTLLASRIDPDNAEDHLRLAEVSLELGLPGHAIAEYREAARLDPSRKKVAERNVKAIREKIATDLLADSTDAFAEGRWAEAKLNAEVIVERFGDTKAAPQTRRLIHKIKELVKAREEVKEASRAEADQALEEALRYEQRADDLRLTVAGGIGISAKEQRLRKKAIAYLEKSWKALKDIQPPPTGDNQNELSFTATRDRIKKVLGDHYLAIGTLYIQRRALPTAEEYNVNACRLDPESGGCILLQDLIVQARLSNGWTRRR